MGRGTFHWIFYAIGWLTQRALNVKSLEDNVDVMVAGGQGHWKLLPAAAAARGRIAI